MSDEQRSDGGQAFPRAGYDGPSHFGASINGMSLRDYFAAKAMQAMVVGPPVPDLMPFERMEQGVARLSYVMADAMLEARK